MCNLVEKYESKKEKEDNIYNETKEVDINKIAEMDNDELVVGAANDAPPPQDAMTTNTEVVAEEVRKYDDVGAKDSDDNGEADDTKGGGVRQ